MKAILFDKYGEAQMCYLAGINKSNEAQWVVVSPGERPVTVKEHYAGWGFREEPMTLLCDCTEVAPATIMLTMLGCVMSNPLYDMVEQMKANIEKLKAWGITWQYSKMDMKFTVVKNHAGTKLKGNYFFYGNCVTKNEEHIATADGYEDLSELIDTIRLFLKVVREDTHIAVGTVSLELQGLTEGDIDAKDKKLFSKIQELEN